MFLVCLSPSSDTYLSKRDPDTSKQCVIDSAFGRFLSFSCEQTRIAEYVSQQGGEVHLSNQGSGLSDQGSDLSDQGLGLSDQGSGLSDQGSDLSDQGTRVWVYQTRAGGKRAMWEQAYCLCISLGKKL